MILSISLCESFACFASPRLTSVALKLEAKKIDISAIRICIIECKQNESGEKTQSKYV